MVDEPFHPADDPRYRIKSKSYFCGTVGKAQKSAMKYPDEFYDREEKVISAFLFDDRRTMMRSEIYLLTFLITCPVYMLGNSSTNPELINAIYESFRRGNNPELRLFILIL